MGKNRVEIPQAQVLLTECGVKERNTGRLECTQVGTVSGGVGGGVRRDPFSWRGGVEMLGEVVAGRGCGTGYTSSAQVTKGRELRGHGKALRHPGGLRDPCRGRGKRLGPGQPR